MNENIKILIIEDNIDLVDMYRVKFEHEGFHFSSALDGEQGLMKAIEEKPDVILLDILMPNMDGWEVMRAIRNNTSLASKILVMSNLGQQDQIDKAYQLGACGYIIKANNTPTEVVEKVKELLNATAKEVYKLRLVPDTYDYTNFMAKAPDPAKASTCSSCFGDVILELVPNEGKQPGKWWHAHFVCSKCGEQF